MSAIEPSQSASSACPEVDSGVANGLPDRLADKLPETRVGSLTDSLADGTMPETVQNEPAVQTPVTAVRPVVAQYDPAVHDEQLEEPAVA